VFFFFFSPVFVSPFSGARERKVEGGDRGNPRPTNKRAGGPSTPPHPPARKSTTGKKDIFGFHGNRGPGKTGIVSNEKQVEKKKKRK